MRIERVAPGEPATIGPGLMILAAVGCFAIGFAALIIVPQLWPRYVQTAAAGNPQAVRVVEAGVNAPRPLPSVQAPGIVTEIRTAAVAPEPQRIVSYGTLAGLAECKAAIRAGDKFENIGPEQMAAMFGTRGKPLTSAQLDTGCRKLTE